MIDEKMEKCPTCGEEAIIENAEEWICPHCGWNPN